MSLVRSVEPTETAVSLAEAKAHLRVDFADDDTYITALINSAVMYAEDLSQRAMVDQTWVQKLDRFQHCIPLVRVPATAVSAVKYKDSAGTLQTLAATEYVVDISSTPGRIVPASGKTWPITLDEIDAVQVTYTAGYGADETKVPDGLKQAVLIHVAQMYENREPVVIGTISSEVPFTYQALINPFMVRRF